MAEKRRDKIIDVVLKQVSMIIADKYGANPYDVYTLIKNVPEGLKCSSLINKKGKNCGKPCGVVLCRHHDQHFESPSLLPRTPISEFRPVRSRRPMTIHLPSKLPITNGLITINPANHPIATEPLPYPPRDVGLSPYKARNDLTSVKCLSNSTNLEFKINRKNGDGFDNAIAESLMYHNINKKRRQKGLNPLNPYDLPQDNLDMKNIEEVN
jgi:hypothetical protein